MASTTPELSEIFPRSDPGQLPSYVTDELFHGEQVVWNGGPTRWSLFRATPFMVVLLVAAGLLAYIARDSGLGPVEFLVMAQSAQEGARALIIPGLVAIYLGFLAFSLRDPRSRWIYVATDRRLMTFFNGRKLRQAGSEGLDRLRVIQGPEMRLRGLGDVVWQLVRGGEHSNESTGPDHGRRGFRGMPDPQAWKERLLAWRDAVRAGAQRQAGEFAARASRQRHDSRSQPGMRTLQNRGYGFSLALPEHWVGRIGLREKRPRRVLGFALPLKLETVSSEPLHSPPQRWNFIEVAGRSGMVFKVDVHDGPPESSLADWKSTVGASLLDADGNLRCGPLAGYRVDYRVLDRMYGRYAMLAGEGFHLLATVMIPPRQADALMPAIDAVFGSVRSA